jgi:hypothetical protein
MTTTPPEMTKQRDKTFSLYRKWQSTHYVAMILIAGGSTIVASNYVGNTSGRDLLALIVASRALYTRSCSRQPVLRGTVARGLRFA